MRAIVFTLLSVMLLAACGNPDRPLRDLRAAGNGPDEFAVIPQEPLIIPPEANLPAPTPGGENLADTQPNADAVNALGGSSAAQVAGGIPAADRVLVGHAGRFGTEPDIRAQLAAEDEQIRERARRLNVFNPLGRDRYFPAYAGQALDANAERTRLISQGIAVPTAPVAPPRAQRPVAAPEEPEEEPRFLQRQVDALIAQWREQNEAAGDTPQNCVFRTVPPDNRLRRVCTPIEPEEQ
ncbi:DUF3035 domain-containing protein [Cognatiyoonia sp. IB215446]|uniref:DUF3035 domain-containing protein n=1 Tax=Cognatiyoonia sp. IB215446 TaxID=3097355 RepID=UPI002A13539E|nr:DUF3035 domain-containing protein [Cognatiyoonia sp. IB215446]MDX8349953.1 DUF3035 domain-containing protein [Cognatiyoonia sp. IB215446]